MLCSYRGGIQRWRICAVLYLVSEKYTNDKDIAQNSHIQLMGGNPYKSDSIPV